MTKPASVADAADFMDGLAYAMNDSEPWSAATKMQYIVGLRSHAATIRAALPRAEALEALVKAAAEWEAQLHEPFGPRGVLGIRIDRLLKALRRVREAK